VTADGRFAIVFYEAVHPDIATYAETPLTYNDGTWHHTAGVLRSGLAEIYVDGRSEEHRVAKESTSVRTTTQTVVEQVASDFVGDIDEVRIFTRALSAAEIATLVPPPPPRTDDLVLFFDMETLTPSGKMSDLSGNMNHGTMTSTIDVAGKIGRARYFPGSGQRIMAPAILVLALNFTVAAWFNWTTNPSPYYGGIQGGGYSWELRVTADGRFAVVFYQAVHPDIATYAETPLAYNDGTWHHAAGVLRSGLAEIYVDGVLVAQDTTNPIASVRTSTLTEIGHVANDFVGDIDEVRIFSRALTAGEIATLTFNSSHTVQRSPEIRFGKSSDPAAKDYGWTIEAEEQYVRTAIRMLGIDLAGLFVEPSFCTLDSRSYQLARQEETRRGESANG